MTKADESGELKEQIARIIAPDSWHRADHGVQSMGSVGIVDSLIRADEILALLARQPLPSSEGGKDLGSSVAESAAREAARPDGQSFDGGEG